MRRPALVALLAGLWLATTASGWMQFESWPADGGTGETVTGLLRLPAGGGPFPVAVLLADCDGISAHERGWARRFAGAGYGAYVIDSFFTRDIESACDGTAEVPVMDDLRGALARADSAPELDAAAPVVVGWQSGADAALAWAATPGPGVAVVFYPSCAETPDLHRPVLFVLPSDYPGSAPCNAYAAVQHAAGVVTLGRIAPHGVGAGFDCEPCTDGYLGGPGGWNAAATGIVAPALFDELDRLRAVPIP